VAGCAFAGRSAFQYHFEEIHGAIQGEAAMSETTTMVKAQVNDFFRPRRLGHANLYVSDYVEAQKFYHSVAGIHEAYRQPDNMASFITNGNTYHDFGLTDVRSPYAPKGQKPGLFHLALELENEVDLVDGYNRAMAAGVKFSHTRDHDVAHSLYLRDPDGNMVEIYADVIREWWTNRHGTIIKKKPDYVPGISSPPTSERNYPVNPEIKVVPEAIFHSKCATHVGLGTKNFEEMFRYYTDIVGLSPLAGDERGSYAVLRGTFGTGDITLLRQRPGVDAGLHHVGIEVGDEANLDRAMKLLPERGIAIERHVEHAARRAINIPDSSGIRLQFFVNRDWQSKVVATVSEADAPYLL
jgi:catechol 2,3-dioxygenase